MLGVTVRDNYLKDAELVDEIEINKLIKSTSRVSIANEEMANLFEAKQLAITRLQENIAISGLYYVKRSDDAKGLLGSYVHNNQLQDNIGSAVSVVDILFERPFSPENHESA